METSKNFEKLTEMVGESAACDILNELIAAEYNRLHPEATFEERNADWEQFVELYTGSAADELITADVLEEYAD